MGMGHKNDRIGELNSFWLFIVSQRNRLVVSSIQRFKCICTIVECSSFSDNRSSNWSAFNESDVRSEQLPNATNTSIEKAIDNQLQDFESMPFYGIVLFLLFACLALTLSVISFVAINRTKKTPYSTKVLSMCLLVFNSLFLISSSIARFFDHAYAEAYIIQHLARAFQIASEIVVGCMALERLLVLNWTYFYHRYNTETRTRIICTCISIGAFLQYTLVRVFACYVPQRPVNCGIGLQAYFLTISIVIPIVAFICYAKIYGIVRQKTAEKQFKYRLTDYKGTLVSFMYLVNTTINLIVYLGLSIFFVIRSKQGMAGDGRLAIFADIFNVVNCIVDPLIYVILFQETRLEILKMINVVFPFFKQKITKMHIEIFNIITYTSNSPRLDTESKDTTL